MKNRSLLAVVALLLVSMVVTAGIGTRSATAQDADLGASLVEGTCDSPGDSVGELRALTEAEGGVLTSFTRVDIAIDDVTGAEHAVVVTLDGDAVACGDVTGSGNDIYVPVAAQGDANYGGIAWLHARDEQTQVSLFISEGLGGSGGAGGDATEVVEPPEDETATAEPVDETPTEEPRATRTPRGGGDDDETPTAEAGEGTTWTSPTYGFTFVYDDSWVVVEESTNPTDNGPQDYVRLFNGTSNAYFFTNSADETFPMERVAGVFQDRLAGQEGVSDVAIHVDDNGDEVNTSDDNSAVFAFDFTYTNADNEATDYYDYYHIFRLPGQGAIVVFLNEGLQRSYDQQADARDALIESVVIPD